MFSKSSQIEIPCGWEMMGISVRAKHCILWGAARVLAFDIRCLFFYLRCIWCGTSIRLKGFVPKHLIRSVQQHLLTLLKPKGNYCSLFLSVFLLMNNSYSNICLSYTSLWCTKQYKQGLNNHRFRVICFKYNLTCFLLKAS